MEISKFRMATNKQSNIRRREYAMYFLYRYQWTAKQKQILNKLAAKGYIISTFNEVRQAFNMPTARNDSNTTRIMTIDVSIDGCLRKLPRKRDLELYAL